MYICKHIHLSVYVCIYIYINIRFYSNSGHVKGVYRAKSPPCPGACLRAPLTPRPGRSWALGPAPARPGRKPLGGLEGPEARETRSSFLAVLAIIQEDQPRTSISQAGKKKERRRICQQLCRKDMVSSCIARHVSERTEGVVCNLRDPDVLGYFYG